MSVADIDDDEDKWQARLKTLSASEAARLLGVETRHGSTPRLLDLLTLNANNQSAKDSALAEAAHWGKREVVALLLKHGANAAHDDSVALSQSIPRGDAAVTEMLLQAGADATARGGTMMAIAIAHRHEDVAEALLRHGADPAVRHRGFNAIEWTAEVALPDLSKKLRGWLNHDEYMSPEFFAKKPLAELRAAMPERHGRSGFHLAASSGNFDIIRQKLVDAGEGLTTADMMNVSQSGGPTLLQALGSTQQLKLAFDAKLWTGRKAEALALYRTQVPATYKPQVDIAAFSAALDQSALKIKAGKFSLKP